MNNNGKAAKEIRLHLNRVTSKTKVQYTDTFLRFIKKHIKNSHLLAHNGKRHIINVDIVMYFSFKLTLVVENAPKIHII